MADIRISQLPVAPSAITGDELVPVVQNGLTVQTTVSAITQSPSLTETFLTVGQQPLLPNSRYFSTGTGLGISDGGALGSYTISLNGTSGSLEGAGTGIIAKTAPNTITARSFAVSGAGVSIANGDGVSGNPTISLSGLPLALANTSGTGLLGVSGSTLTPLTITGTANEVDVANGDGSGGNPTIGLADNVVVPGNAGVTVPNGGTGARGVSVGQVRYNTDTNRFEGLYSTGWQDFGIGDGAITSIAGTTNQIVVSTVGGAATVSIDPDPVIPGNAAIQVPSGTTVQRPGGVIGQFRYNTDTNSFEGYDSTAWRQFSLSGGVTSFSAGSTGFTPNTATSGAVVLSGTLNAASGGTGASTLTGYVYGNGTGAMTASTTIPTADLSGTVSNAQLANSSVTYNGVNVALGASGTITAANPYALTIGTGLSGTSYDGSAPTTIAIDSTVATLTGIQTLTNKTISGAANTLSSIGNSSLTNSSLTIGTTNIALGATSLTLDGLTSVAVTGNPTTALQLTTKQYVDNLVASGVNYHTPVRLESPDTAGNLNATYNNGTAGVGATLTNAGTQVALTIDGVATVVGDRVLIYNQTNAAENGVYTVTNIGSGSTNWVLTRATDANTYGPGPSALDEGSAFFVQAGNTGAGETYVCSTVGTITFGTTPITFAQISAVQVYSAGNGLTLTGTQFSLTTPVTAANGGTGLGSYTTGDLIYASGSSALSKLAAGTNGYLLTMNAGLPSWQPAPASGVTSFQTSLSGLTPSTSTTGAVTLAGTLGVASGGTGLASVTANRIPYGNGTSALSTSANLTFDGTTLTNTGNAIISDNSSNAALRITQVGAGNALLVEDSANPDSTPFVVDASGRVGIGGNPSVSLETFADTTNWVRNQSAAGIPIFATYRANGTIASKTIVVSGDEAGRFDARGYDGANFIQLAQIGAFVDGTPGTNDMPGRLVFSTTADGASSPTERMRINNAGEVGIGATTLTGISLRVQKNLTGSTSTSGIRNDGVVQSDSTTSAVGYYSAIGTAASAFTLPNLYHQRVLQGTFGATSAVTNQYGYFADATLTGATNNYGFYSNIASGTGRWNFYAAGTADNYFAGNVGIGIATPSQKLTMYQNAAVDIYTSSGNSLSTWLAGNTSSGNYAIYSNSAYAVTLSTSGSERMRITSAGNVGVGTASPAVKLAISSTDAILVPVGTTAERPTGATGYIRYNTTTGGFEGYSGAAWGSLGGGNTTTYGLWENNATISANYTITAGNNAVSAGPITVASGATVTVPSGSTWTIV